VRSHHPQIRIRPWFVRKDKVKQLFSYSIFTFLANISQAIRFRLDNVVIAMVLPKATALVAVAHYNIAAMLIQNFRLGLDAMFGVLFPYFSRVYASGDQARMQRLVLFAIRRSVQVSLFFGFALLVWGRDFIEAWINPEFLDAYPPLVVLATAISLTMGQFPAYSFLYGTSRNQFVAIVNMIEAALNLGLTLLLIGPLGLLGVALGTAIPMLTMQCTVLPIYTARRLGVGLPKYLRNYLRGAMVSLIALLPVAAIAHLFSVPSLPMIFLQGFAGLAVYIGMLWLIESLLAEPAQRRAPWHWALATPERV